MISTPAIAGIIATVAVMAVVLGLALSFLSTASSNIQENNMCENWHAANVKWNTDYNNMNILEKMGVDVESHNQDINEYNRQCAYQ